MSPAPLIQSILDNSNLILRQIQKGSSYRELEISRVKGIKHCLLHVHRETKAIDTNWHLYASRIHAAQSCLNVLKNVLTQYTLTNEVGIIEDKIIKEMT